MQFYLNTSLQPYHTFGIDQACQQLVIAESVDELIAVYRDPQWQSVPKYMLGKGSNVLFTTPYQGMLLINRIQGLEQRDDEQYHYLHVSAGQDWPELVEWTVQHNIAGLENLALIPGCTGSAPIQNIGAYGVELKDVCEYVDYLCLATYTTKRLSKSECQFGYRDSIFKQALYGKAIIIAVGLKLAKQWQPKTQYGPLKALGADATCRDIFAAVCQIRREKLPNPYEQGNAGSFFKNPIVDTEQFSQLQTSYPDIVGYSVDGGVKLAAGWLIEHSGLKGEVFGGAQVHPKQALVIVNQQGKATAQDVVRLAAKVRAVVKQKYGVMLEHEVRFMGPEHEISLDQAIETYNERS
ncbi:MAG: UDP-N-acetylmuramate dehydrogenase [Vibrio sp.]